MPFTPTVQPNGTTGSAKLTAMLNEFLNYASSGEETPYSMSGTLSLQETGEPGVSQASYVVSLPVIRILNEEQQLTYIPPADL